MVWEWSGNEARKEPVPLLQAVVWEQYGNGISNANTHASDPPLAACNILAPTLHQVLVLPARRQSGKQTSEIRNKTPLVILHLYNQNNYTQISSLLMSIPINAHHHRWKEKKNLRICYNTVTASC